MSTFFISKKHNKINMIKYWYYFTHTKRGDRRGFRAKI